MLHPPHAFAEDVVIGKRQKIVVVRAIPFRDHLRKIVPVAPQRVRMQVAFPPAQWRIGRNHLIGKGGPGSGCIEDEQPPEKDSLAREAAAPFPPTLDW